MSNKRGFTLIEIVIVIVIIAILAAILVPSITRWIDKSKLAKLKAEADTVRNSVAAYLIQEVKDNLNTNTVTDENVIDYCDDFWDGASEAANKKLQNVDEDKDGYMTFKVEKGSIIYFTYSSGGHTAIYDGLNWEYD